MQRDRLLIEEMITAAERAIDLVAGLSPTELADDRNATDALLWNFTVLGEAATQVSAETKARHSDVEWANPVRLRNRIVHGYWSIDLAILHTTATGQLGGFVEQLRAMLAVMEGQDTP